MIPRQTILYVVLFFFHNLAFAQQPIKLIIRADDMGNAYDIGVAVIKAHKDGIVTSVSIMPTSPYFEEAVRLCKENPALSAGLHITLLGTRLRPLLSPDKVPSLVTKQGFFYETGAELEKANPNLEEMEREMLAQIDKAKASGLHFVYLDYHRGPPQSVQDLVMKLCREQKLIYGQDFSGSLHGFVRLPHDIESWPAETLPDGQLVYYSAPSLTMEKEQLFFDLLTNLKPGQWTLVMHPGMAGPERASVTDLLCSPNAKEIIKIRNIQLVSYNDLWEAEFGNK